MTSSCVVFLTVDGSAAKEERESIAKTNKELSEEEVSKSIRGVSNMSL
jgi:hypothetical protein